MKILDIWEFHGIPHGPMAGGFHPLRCAAGTSRVVSGGQSADDRPLAAVAPAT